MQSHNYYVLAYLCFENEDDDVKQQAVAEIADRNALKILMG